MQLCMCEMLGVGVSMQYKKIVFVTYGGGHARMLAPVVESLSQVKGIEVSVLALTTAMMEFDDQSIRLYGYKDFFYENPRVIKYGEILAKDLDTVVDYEETVAYLGQNYLELVDDIGEDKANKKYKKLGRQAFEPKKSLNKILKVIAPDLVVATNSPRSEKAAIQAARDLNMPSVALIDMFSIRCESWFSKTNYADKILVLSESVKKHLISIGRDEASIVVTGNPAFDSLVRNYTVNRKEIITKKSNLPFTVLWASQREPEYCQETNLYGDTELPIKLENTLLKIFEKHSNWQLIARNHPSEAPREYPDFVKKSSQSEDLVELLSNVHVVVTLTSTVGFQGGILGADFITVDCSVFTPTMPFSEMGFSVGVQSVTDVEKELEKLYENMNTNNSKSIYCIEDATQRVVKEILTMMRI